MAQMTWRAPQQLLDRVKAAAALQGRSVNGYVSAVLAAATDPSLGGTEAERVRERLASAGLLVTGGAPRHRPPATEVAAARRAAGKGTSLQELVRDGRR